MALPKPALDCMAGWTLPFNLLFLTFDLGSDLHHNLRDLSTFPSFLIFSNGVISPNKIVAYLTLCWHLLKNWWRTQTHIPSLVPNAQSLGLNSAVWPIGPFAIWLLLTSFFSLSLLLFCAPPDLFTFFPCSIISCPWVCARVIAFSKNISFPNSQANL